MILLGYTSQREVARGEIEVFDFGGEESRGRGRRGKEVTVGD